MKRIKPNSPVALFKVGALCLTLGTLVGCGIFNLDKLTLSDVPSNNDGISANPDDLPDNVKSIAKITTQGNKVLFDGQPGSIAGMSLFWSNAGWGGEKFYNADIVSWLKKDWNIKLIRAPMGVGADKSEQGGYLQNSGTQTQLIKTIVNAAIDNNIYVIIDWHTHYAERKPAEAVAFFTEMAKLYGEYDNVIYEIYNEPLAISWSNTIKPYAQQVIAAIRAVDPDNLIIVGTPNWSQDVDAASLDPITGFNNIAYTLHFYAGSHKQSLRDKATTALSRGIPLFVTEWGSVDADGDGGVDQAETSTWLNFLKANGISHVNWTVNDKPEGSSALVEDASTSGGWTDANLTESGKLLKKLIKNW